MATRYVHIHLDTVSSTQDEARRRAEDGGGPVLVTAGTQVSGRGRYGRSWIHAPRAMAASFAFAPLALHRSWVAERVTLIPLMAGLAMRRVVGTAAVGLKWPNDLVAGEAKVGGLLTEAAGHLVVVGCGVNLWWPDPPSGMGALYDEDPGPEAAGRLAARWAEALLDRVEAGAGAWGHAEYVGACVTVGTDVAWDPDGSGRAVDVDAAGGLVVETAHGRIVLSSGEVRAVRPTTLPPAAAERRDDGR